MYLGETHHNNLQDLSRQIKSGMILPEGHFTAKRQTTPRRIITFMTRVLGDHKAGYVDLAPSNVTDPNKAYSGRNTMSGMPQQFFTRSGYGV